MARGVNKVILIGNLGADPEVRYMPSGGAVANVNMATSESWKDKNTGEAQERTEWHRVVFFNRLAEIVGEYVKKGSKIYVEGSLRTRKWQDKTGVERYTTEIVAAEMQMLDSRGGGSAEFDSGAPRARPAPAQSGGGFGGGGSPGPSGGYGQPQGGGAPAPSRGMENDIPWADDDIPF